MTDVLSRQYLSQAVVEVYANYNKTSTSLSGEDGGVLLHVPYRPGMLVTVVACKDGYICTVLPCKTHRMPSMLAVQCALVLRVDVFLSIAVSHCENQRLIQSFI